MIKVFFRIISRKDRSSPSLSAADIPDEEWCTYYESEFAASDQHLELFYEAELDQFLATSPNKEFVVSAASIEDVMRHIKA
jgi:hypothetical protein